MTAKSPRPRLYTATERVVLDPSFLIPSRALGYGQAFGNIVVFAVLLGFASVAHGVWQGVVLYVAIGFSLHRLFFPVHDCIHYSLFPAKIENRVFGSLLSALLGASFHEV